MARILLIDDDKAVLTMMSLTLAHFGHTVAKAHNGREGLELFARTKPELLITDIVMPETGGLEVLLELRRKYPPVKTIAISGGGRLSAPQYLHMTKLMGVTKVLEKPFSSEALIAAVNELLAEPDGPGKPPPSA